MSPDRTLRRIRREYRRSPGSVELAEVASLAVRIEPHLLRGLRIDLCEPLDVGAEADFWFSTLVGSRGADHVVMNPEVAAVLRAELATDRSRLDDAFRVTSAADDGQPGSLQLEEKLHYLGLTAAPVTEIERALRPALRTMAAGGDAARELSHWALRALPTLFPEVLQTVNGFTLLAAAQSIVGPIVEQVPEVDVRLRDVVYALPASALTDTVEVGVELTATGIGFGDDAPPSRRIEVPRSMPMIVELEWTSSGATKHRIAQVEPGRAVVLPGAAGPVTVRTMTGDEYRLEPVAATGEGRDDRLRCVIVTGSGKRADGVGRPFDFDLAAGLMERSIEGLGYSTHRADPTDDIAAVAALLDPELVIADVSIEDRRVLFLLGVRHALRPRGTIVVAEAEQSVSPELQSLAIRRYSLTDIESGGDSFTRELAAALDALDQSGIDSPVYSALPGLVAPSQAAGDETHAGPQAVSAAPMAQQMLLIAGDRPPLPVELLRVISTVSEEHSFSELLTIESVESWLGAQVMEVVLSSALAIVDLSTAAGHYLAGVRSVLRRSGTVLIGNNGASYGDLSPAVVYSSDPGDEQIGDFDRQLRSVLRTVDGEIESQPPNLVDAAFPDREPPSVMADPPVETVEQEPLRPDEQVFTIEMLPAEHGRSVLLVYGDQASPTPVLIDSGVRRTADIIRTRLEAFDRRLELLVITHIDDDAIAGAIALLEDPGIEIGDVWFNGYPQLQAVL